MAKKNRKFNLANLICTDGFNNSIGGDYFSKDYRFIEIILNLCLNEERCAPKTEIEAFLARNYVNMIYKDTLNDKKNTKQHFKTFLN
jgi:hypothetical protein